MSMTVDAITGAIYVSWPDPLTSAYNVKNIDGTYSEVFEIIAKETPHPHDLKTGEITIKLYCGSSSTTIT